MAASEQEGTGREGRALVWLSVIGAALLLVGISISLLAGEASSPTSSGQPPLWRENLGFAVVMVGCALIVTGLVRMVRAQMVTTATARREQVRTLTTGQRRQVVCWIRQGEPAPQEMARATTVTAQALALQPMMTLSYVGMVLMAVGIALGQEGLWWLVSTGVVAVLMAAATVLVHRDADLAQRWLDVHRQPATTEVSGS